MKTVRSKNPNLIRELRIMKSTLEVSKKRDMSETSVGKLLQSRGYISRRSGKITERGRKALSVL
jgi:hypothetical protein